MEIKILQVFLGADGLPYKDQERTVHFPIVGSGFQGASNTTKIRFYYDELVEQDDTETAWVACAKLPNGKIGSKVLETDYDSTLGEHYALLELDSFYFQYKGDVYISLQGYQGGVQVSYDEETELYTINGTPTISATGSIKLSVNYATQFVGSGETSNVNFQRILADLGTKLGIRAQSEHVEELPSVGQNDIFYVVNDDPNDPNLQNIYVWNENTQSYVWVGDNTLDLGEYYTKEQGEQFEIGIDNRVTSVEDELSSVAQGSPKGVYATLSDLETAHPTGTTGIFIVSANGHWYYWNGTAWTDGGTYQAVEIADGSVTLEKTTFIIGVKNIFNKDNTTSGYYDQANGTYHSSSSYSNTGYMVIEGIKTLTDNAENGGQRHYCFYTKDKTFISGGYTQNTWTIPNNAYYLIVSIQNTMKDTYMLSVGTSVPNAYQPYQPLKLASSILIDSKTILGKIGKEQVSFIIPASKNLFNKNTVQYNKYCKQNDGTVAELDGWVMSEYIEISPTKLKLIDTVSTSGSRHYVFFDNTKTYISGGYGTGSFSIPLNAKYIVVSFNLSYNPLNNYQLEYGDTSTSYEEYYPEHLDNSIQVNAQDNTNFRVLTVGNNKEYSTISSAYSNANEGDIILVYEGTYNEELHFTKNVSLIGTNREKCILQYSGAEYNHEPLSFVKGVIKNLTISTLQDTMVGNTPAYCLHIDSRNGSKNQAVYIENVKFIQNMQSDAASTVGLALANNFTLEFVNCEFINNGNGVAFYCHSCEIFSDTSYTDLTGQKLIVKNCSMLNNSSTKPTILIQSEEIEGAYAECLWQRNIVVNQNADGDEIGVQYYTGGAGSPDLPKNNWLNTTDWHNSVLSLMNNIDELNH